MDVYKKCGDVLDGWRKQLEEQGLATGKKDFNSTKYCLLRATMDLEEKLLHCVCPHPCKEINFSEHIENLDLRSGPINHWQIIYSVKSSEVSYSKQIPDYTMEDYLGGVGGILGVGLGISVASIMELLVYLIIFIIGKLKSCI